MKYVLYIDYRANYKPLTSEYRMLEADKQYNPDTIYLMRIMVKDGKAEKVESDIKRTAYRAILERRTRWTETNAKHVVGYYKAPFAEWFKIM